MTAVSERGPKSRPTPMWLFATIAGVFALVFAYAVWNAIGNLVASAQAASSAGLQLTALGWFLWIFAAVIPVVVYVIAFLVTRRLRVLGVVLVFVTALALVSAFWLDVVAFSITRTTSLVG